MKFRRKKKMNMEVKVIPKKMKIQKMQLHKDLTSDLTINII